MDFKQLEAFVTTVDCRSFSEAARKLYLTQPTISAHINSLEAELGTKLLNRTTKKMELTARGEEFYEFASSVINMRENVLKEFTGDCRKLISIGASTIPSTYILPELINDFRKQDSDIEFQIWQADSGKVISRVEEGSFDFGLTGAVSDHPDCIFVPFCDDTLTIVTANTPYYQKMKLRHAGLEEILREPFIMRESGSGTRKELETFLSAHRIDITRLNCILRLNDLEALKRMIACGMGISIVSRRSVTDLLITGNLLEIPLPGETATRHFYIVCNKTKTLKPHVDQFIRFIQKYYKPKASGD